MRRSVSEAGNSEQQKMTLERKLLIGIPKGHLNRPDCIGGYTKRLLELAGWKLEGYEPGEEKSLPEIVEGDREVQFVCMKPRQFPTLLENGLLDLAIIGKDLVEERYSELWKILSWDIGKEGYTKYGESPIGKYFFKFLNGTYKNEALDTRFKLWEGVLDIAMNLQRGKYPGSSICELKNLNYGSVNICFGCYGEFKNWEELFPLREDINISTAYPNLTYRELCKVFLKDSIKVIGLNLELPPSLDFLKVHSSDMIKPDKSLFKPNYFNLFPITSKTESLCDIGLGKVIVECVATGRSFNRHQISHTRDILTSSTAHLYSSTKPLSQNRVKLLTPEREDILQNDQEVRWKREKIKQVAEKLVIASDLLVRDYIASY